MKMKVLLLKEDLNNGFSYSFSKLLLNRLFNLLTNDQIFIKDSDGKPENTVPLVLTLAYYLDNQIPCAGFDSINNNMIRISVFSEEWIKNPIQAIENLNNKVKKIINNGYDFLKTFERIQ